MRGDPPATTPGVRSRMRAQPSRDTKPEVALRRELHAMGLRFFTHRRPLEGLRCEADVVFPRARVAVFVQGCFWHGCGTCSKPVKSHSDWWYRKIGRNRERDARNRAALEMAGWEYVEVWEHEDLTEAAGRVAQIVSHGRARALLGPSGAAAGHSA